MIDEVKKYLEENEERFSKTIRTSNYKETSKLLLRFLKKGLTISKSMSKLHEKEELYSLAILHRSLIDHTLTAHHILSKARLASNDSFAETYYKEYLAYELIITESFNDEFNITPELSISRLFKELKSSLDSNDLKWGKARHDIFNESSKFKTKNILKEFKSYFPFESDNFVSQSTIFGLIENFNFLSSFVHGGPTADFIDTHKNDAYVGKNALKWSKKVIFVFLVFFIYSLVMGNSEIEDEIQIVFDKFKKHIESQATTKINLSQI